MSRTVVIQRIGSTASTDPSCFNRLHWALEPVARARPGDYIVFETRDAFDNQFDWTTEHSEVAACDLNRVHPMTGPVHIEGAERGDALAVTIVDIEPADFGYTVVVPGFGFLRDLIPGPFIAKWRLDRLCAVSDQIPSIRIPMCGFPGSIGVMPGPKEVAAALAREGELAQAGGFALLPDPGRALPARLFGSGAPWAHEGLRTVPPRENGGNMDVKTMQVGATVVLPVLHEGAGLWTGDIHFAQGDGEVCGSAIEMAARVTYRCELRKGAGSTMRYPQVEGNLQLRNSDPGQFLCIMGVPIKEAGYVPPHLAYLESPKVAGLTNLSEDLTLAARDALVRIIDWLVLHKDLTKEQAYVIAAAAVDLRIAQVVDVPNVMVSAVLPLNIFSD